MPEGFEIIEEEAWNFALKYATRSMRTKKEILRRMLEKGYARECAEGCIAKLSDYGYADDAAYARAFIHDHAAAGSGPCKLAAELRRKGVDDELFEPILTETDFTAICLGAAKKYIKGQPLDSKLRQKAANYLWAKGFGRNDIDAALGGADEQGE